MLNDTVGPLVLGVLVVLVVLLIVLGWVVLRRRGGSETSPDNRGGRRRRGRPSRDHFRDATHTEDEAPRKRAAVIANPTKFHDISVPRERITEVCRETGWDDPLWLETTAEDPGSGQAREAVAHGVDVVCALGGDGTVRHVASGLLGTHTPMAILAAGTGNLLARNLELPHALRDSTRVALRGRNKRVDVGRVRVNPSGEHERPEEHIFLIMAGIGFDAVVVGDAPEKLKARVGWLAYGVSGLRHLPGSSFKVRARFGDTEIRRRVQTVLIGNCGRLTGGLVLMPDAQIDDGQFDSVMLSPKGVVGWVAVAGRVITRRRAGHERVEHHQSTEAVLQADRPVEVQVDGDSVGAAREITATIDPLALTVRVPA